MKMAVFFVPLFFLCVSVAGQELLQILSFHQHDSTPDPLQMFLGVYVHQEKLNELSTSILMAENWLRTHVLSIYPSTNVNSIVVSNGFGNQDEISRFTADAMENVYHCLVRWGLEKKIKVSVLISPKLLRNLLKNSFKNSNVERVFEVLEGMNSSFTVKLPDFSDETFGGLSSDLKSMADLGFFRLIKSLNILNSVSKPTSRKLSFIVPSDAAAATPLPPLIGITSPPPSFSPEMQPPVYGQPPHYGVNLPPCNPHPGGRHGGGGATAAPPPAVVGGGGVMAGPPAVSGGGSTAAAPFSGEGVWCVAKPSVPSEKLQEAMDYACGDGGADCEAINPAGSCYFPDSVVAHASYAFNSYWQKNKNNGGTCGFGGTAMLINSDPSFLQCHFTLE